MTPDGQTANPLDKAAIREPFVERLAKPEETGARAAKAS
jgi:hypothetical protein